LKNFLPILLRVLVLPALVGSALAAPPLATEPDTVHVIDGNRLTLNGTRIRLYGIAAPDLRQSCEWPNKTIPCGAIAKTAMMDLIAGARVVCRERTETRHAETRHAETRHAETRHANADHMERLAICYAGGFDIGANMVHTGWALADPKTPSNYATIEARARQKARGLWKGRFVRPWEWHPPAAPDARPRTPFKGTDTSAILASNGSSRTGLMTCIAIS